jgi:protein-disulfide isomerase
VNAYAGHRLIDDLRLVQGTIAAAPMRASLPKPSAETERRVAGQVAGIKDPDLRQVLARLGARIATTRRSVLLAGLGTLLIPERPQAQPAEIARLLAVLPSDHVLGKADAPNIIIDYFSFTCPFCANFNAAVMPAVKKEWVETGKARLVMRHFPSDQVATRAALMSEGAGPNFFEAVDIIFKTQTDWLTAPDPSAELAKTLTAIGISPQQAAGFMSDDKLLDKILIDVQSGQKLGVKGTPNLFINEQYYGMPQGGADAIAAILRQVAR